MPRLGDEVLIGPGTLYTAPKGTAFPADPSVAPAVAWVEIGYSEEGWVFVVGREFADVVVAEEVDPIKILQTARTLNMRGASAQASLDTIKLAMGGGTISTIAGPPARKKYVPPTGSSIAPDVMALLFRSKAPAVAGVEKVRQLAIPQAISIGAIEMAHQKAPAKTVVAIDFRLTKPDSANIFEIEDLT